MAGCAAPTGRTLPGHTVWGRNGPWSWRIYSGDFSKTLISGSGVAARLLAEHGIPIYGESRLDCLL